MDVSNENEWWGYSQEHGWVVLNRNVVENQPDNFTELLFIRCSDWSIYAENKENWEPPKYIFSNKYVSNLSVDDREKSIHELTRLKNEYQHKRRNLYAQPPLLKHSNKHNTISKHKAFLELMGKEPGSYRFKVLTDRVRRVTHCHNCANHLDNIQNLECTKCNWIICENCGACGCGYYQRIK